MLNEEPKKSRLIPVTKWGEFHLWPPIGGLRHLIFNRENNGFQPAFKFVGGRVLVDEDAFFTCVDAHSDNKNK